MKKTEQYDFLEWIKYNRLAIYIQELSDKIEGKKKKKTNFHFWRDKSLQAYTTTTYDYKNLYHSLISLSHVAAIPHNYV